MAVFGNLMEFPLLEVIGMLEHRCGILHLYNIERFEDIKLHINFGILQGLIMGDKVWRDGSVARQVLVEVANLRKGRFEFQRLPTNAPEMLNDLAIGINEVLLGGAAFNDEWNNYKDHLPDPQTRFTLASEELVWLEGGLQEFWKSIEPLLEYGISIDQVASHLNLDVRLVQLNFYKLRTIGLVRPARRIQEVADIRAGNFPQPQKLHSQAEMAKPQPANSKPTMISKLIGALRFIGRSV